jgi:hypothetical protein
VLDDDAFDPGCGVIGEPGLGSGVVGRHRHQGQRWRRLGEQFSDYPAAARSAQVSAAHGEDVEHD